MLYLYVRGMVKKYRFLIALLVCVSQNLLFTPSAKAFFFTDPDNNQVVTDPTICKGEVATFTMSSSQLGVNYTLINLNKDTIGIVGVHGTGEAINFTVSPVITTTYYILAVMDNNNTEKIVVLDPAVVTVNELPTVINVTDGARCDAGEVTLKATPSAGSIEWYSASTNGVLLFTGLEYKPTISATTNYYAAALSNGCHSSTRTLVKATINTKLATPTIDASPNSICDKGPLTLTANSINTGTTTIHWKDNFGASSIGSVWNIAEVNKTTTYKVYAENAGCSSDTATKTINVIARPTVSSANASPNAICDSENVTFTATASVGVIKWYDQPTGGNSKSATNPFTTKIKTTTTYYAEADDNGCISANRTGAVVTVTPTPTVNPIANPSEICEPSNVLFTATSSAGGIKWYNQFTGGSEISANNSFNEQITATKTYYAEATNNGCHSVRVPVTVTLKNKVTLTVGYSPSNICDAGQVTLTATTAANNPTITWYKKSGNQQLFVGNPYIYTLDNSTNYEVYAVVNSNGCNSDQVAIQPKLTITPKITNYSSNTQTCINTSASLSATANDGDINWYNAFAGGILQYTGASYATPALNTNTTYYIEATKSGCTSSPRIAVPVTVLDVKINNTTAASRCGAGTVTLSATSSSGAGVFKWYNAATGGAEIYTGAAFTTPNIQTTTDYFVSVTDQGCTSARVKVTATVNAEPQLLTVENGKKCGSGDVILKATATANSTINWYTTNTSTQAISSGNTFVAQNIYQSTTYYVEAVLNGCPSSARMPVTATINPIPNAPTTVGDESCGLNILLNLHATPNPNNSKDTLKWYEANGKYIQTGPDLNKLVVFKTITYYVDATNVQGCTSLTRTPVTATIKPVPAAPTTTSASRCDPGVLKLSAVGTGTLKWYNNQNGTGYFQDGNSYTTPILSTTTTYYVKAEENGCLSSASPVTASINIAPKITSTSSNFRCGAGTVLLRASCNMGVIKWYNAPTNGDLLKTNDTLITPYLTTTTDYWVEANNNGCISSTRILVKASINAVPNAPVATGAERCGAGSVQLIATATLGDTINWYDSPTSIISLGQGSPLNTPNISNTTKYYVSAKNGVCSSARIIATATINQIPTITSTTSSFVCDQGIVTLKAATNIGNINWYIAAIGGLPVGDKPTYTTPSISDTTYYYVEAENNKCVSTPRIKVAANVYKSPKILTQPLNTTGCTGSTVFYEVIATGSMLTYQWQTETAPNTFTNINDNATYSGTKTAVLTINISAGLSKLNYKCLISSACNPVSTNVATLTINNNASILLQPISVNSCTGNNAVFKTAASGGSLNYQWKVDDGSGFKNIPPGAPYTGANTATLTINNVTTSLNGYNYSCFVSSVICNTSALSDVAVLTVNKIDIANAGNDQTICIDTAVLKGSTPINGSGTWTQLSGTGVITDAKSARTSVKGLSIGKNEFVWEIKNGNCNSKDTVVINTNTAVPAANAGLDQTICAKNTIISANAAPIGSMGQWRLVSGTGDIANKNNQSTAVTNLGLGKNIFIWKIENGACSSEDAVIIDVVTPPVANAGIDQKICAVTTKLTANNPTPGKGKWMIISGGGVIADSTSPTATVTKLTEGKNLFIWTITLGSCFSSDSLVIDVSIPPSKAIAGKDQNICDDSTFLSAMMPAVGTGKWSKISGPGTIVDPTQYNTKVVGLNKSVSLFSWTVSKNNCSSSTDTVRVEYTTLSASVDAGKDQNICKSSAELTSSSKFVGTGRWQVATGSGLLSQPNNDTTLVTGLSVGENKFIRLFNSSCGFAIDTVIVIRSENPTNSFAGNYEQICASELELSANTPLIGIGKWTIINGSGDLNDVNNPNAIISNLIPGNTVLRWTISSGACMPTSSDVLIKRLSPDNINCAEYQVIIPTGFSPNGDNINDNLVIEGIEKYPGAIVRIFSYLGDLVYEKKDYRNDWDATTGNVKGILGNGKLPAGTYYLNIDLNNGHVTKTKFIVIKY